jgi:hypothetical protein
MRGSSRRSGPSHWPGSYCMCVRRADGGLRYVDAFESQEARAAAFEARIHPAVDRVFGGYRPGSAPTVERLEVLNATGALLEQSAG